MKYLIISEGGDGIGLATRLEAEGNETKIWIRDPEAHKRGKGIVDQLEYEDFGDVVVADCTGSGPLLDAIGSTGRLVLGGSGVADRLEFDRTYAEKVMRDCGIKTPKSKSFSDWETAISFVQSNADKRLVFKPEGSLSGIVPSQVTRDSEELLKSIEHFKTLVGSSTPEFVLQEFIEGLAVSTEGWFDGEKWIEPFNHTIERKSFLDGDVGPSGGCTGNIVWCCEGECPVVEKGLGRLEEFLRDVNYKGAIDLNTVVNDSGVYGLEFTPRFGYDAFPTFISTILKGDLGEFLYDVATGSGGDFMDVSKGFGAGIRLSIPPWPTERYHAEEGVAIEGLTKASLEWFYGYDIEFREGGFYSSGGCGILGVANGAGDTVSTAFDEAYRRVRRIKVADAQYRNDLGEVILKDYNKFNRLVKELS